MDEVGPTASIIFVVLLLLNMMIYGFNVAIEYLNEKEIEKSAQEDQEKKALRLMKLLEHNKECRNTTQLVSIFAYVFMGYYCVKHWIPGIHTVTSFLVLLYVRESSAVF